MDFSNKWNAQRGAKRAGLEIAALDFFECDGRWTWRAKGASPAAVCGAPVRIASDNPRVWDQIIVVPDGPVELVPGGDVCDYMSADEIEAMVHAHPMGVGDALTTLRFLVERPDGATIAEIAEATGWEKATAHAKITSELKKRLGLKIASDQKDKGRGGRIYRAIGEARQPELFGLFQASAGARP